MGTKQHTLLLLLFLVFNTIKLSAQFPNPADFNTATNATNTGTLPTGAPDLHWSASMTGINGTYLPAVSVGSLAPAAWAISPYVNADWITYPHTCMPNNWPDHSCNGAVDVYYKLIVNLPASNCAGNAVATPSAYCLTFDYFSDNWVNAIYVNGVLSYTNFIANPGGSWGFLTANKKTVSLCNNWVPGSNTVIVYTSSGSGWGGFLAQANHTVSTNYANVLTASVAVTNPPCFNGVGSATATGGGVSGPYTYTWLPTGGNANTAGNLSPGTYSVIVGAGSCSITKTLNILPGSAQFSISVSPSATLCEGSSTTFTSSGAASYTWSTGAFGSNLTSSVTGVYSVTGSNINGCTDTKTVSLTVYPNPTVTASGNTLVCVPGQSTNLVSNGALTYTWSPGNIHGNSVVFTPFVNTTYTVEGTDFFGCTDTGNITVDVNTASILTGPALDICAGESATLTAGGVTTYTWLPGNSNGPSYVVTPSASQNYTALGTVNGCTFSANQSVTVTAMPTVSISDPEIVCPGSPLSLTASGAAAYVWMPGNLSGSSITVAPMSTQVYTITGSNGNCSVQVTQEVTVVQNVNLTLSPNTTICKGETEILTANGASGYIWQPGAGTGSSFTVQPFETTTYTVIAMSGTCAVRGTVTVNVSSVLADFVDNSANGNYLDQVEFTNLSLNNTANAWFFNNGSTSSEVNPVIGFEDPGTYVACLLVTNTHGCMDTLCKIINVGCPEDAVFIPNTFTPNEDGLNDVFRVSTLGQCLESFEMTLFDRWGEAIFTSKKLEEGWDGTIKNVPAKDDVYAYLVNYTMINKKAYSKAGHVTLIR